ncbi:MAG: hypothetical protein ACYTFA_13400, partial [Planctomycetota bacterium]
MRTPFRYNCILVTSFVVVLFVGLTAAARGAPPTQGPYQSQPATSDALERSGGSYQLHESSEGVVLGPHSGRERDQVSLERSTG